MQLPRKQKMAYESNGFYNFYHQRHIAVISVFVMSSLETCKRSHLTAKISFYRETWLYCNYSLINLISYNSRYCFLRKAYVFNLVKLADIYQSCYEHWKMREKFLIYFKNRWTQNDGPKHCNKQLKFK